MRGSRAPAARITPSRSPGLVPGFFEYLTSERGLRPASVTCYRHHLDRFEAYLQRVGVAGLDELSPALLSAFVAERSGAGLAKTTVREGCGVLRVFLRYAHREGLVRGDLWKTVEWPQACRLSTIPRSISWEDVGKVLAAVDRRTPCGKRDYAILLLLATYGLRGREVAALTLDDIDWRRERLAIPERKAGHSTAFPLSGAVGQALRAGPRAQPGGAGPDRRGDRQGRIHARPGRRWRSTRPRRSSTRWRAQLRWDPHRLPRVTRGHSPRRDHLTFRQALSGTRIYLTATCSYDRGRVYLCRILPQLNADSACRRWRDWTEASHAKRSGVACADRGRQK